MSIDGGDVLLDVLWDRIWGKYKIVVLVKMVFIFQAEDGIRDLVRSRGLGDVYKRQVFIFTKLLQVILLAAKK